MRCALSSELTLGAWEAARLLMVEADAVDDDDDDDHDDDDDDDDDDDPGTATEAASSTPLASV